MIKKLTLGEVRKIYTKYMVNDFPLKERRTFLSIEKMWKDGCYFGYGYYVEDVFFGYALFCAAPEGKMALLDYLAMTKSSRGTGKGSAFLKELSAIDIGMDAILLETEDIDFAATEAEVKERTRRDHFYEKAKVILTSFRSEVFGVKYRIWYIPMNKMVTATECAIAYADVYRYIFKKVRLKKIFVLYEKENENFEPVRM